MEPKPVNFSLEEICSNCKYAHWHVCENCYDPENPRFCHCEIAMEEFTDGINGTCPTYTHEKIKGDDEEEGKLVPTETEEDIICSE